MPCIFTVAMPCKYSTCHALSGIYDSNTPNSLSHFPLGSESPPFLRETPPFLGTPPPRLSEANLKATPLFLRAIQLVHVNCMKHFKMTVLRFVLY